MNMSCIGYICVAPTVGANTYRGRVAAMPYDPVEDRYMDHRFVLPGSDPEALGIFLRG